VRMGLCVLMILSLAGCATRSPAPAETPEPVRLPPPPIPAECRPELLNTILRPALLPEALSVREALSVGADDRARATTNADIGDDLQACVQALISQREKP
jgi:hypothetical protein